MTGSEFRQALDRELAQVSVSPALRQRTLTALKGKEGRTMKHKFSVAMAVMLAIMLMGTVAMAAAGYWGLLDFTGLVANAYVPEGASAYISRDVARYDLAGMSVSVREAYYDGYSAHLTVDVHPDSQQTLLMGVFESFDDLWHNYLRVSAENQPEVADTILDVYKARGCTKAYYVSIDVPDGGSGCDYVLNEDGTLTYYYFCEYEDYQAERAFPLVLTAVPYVDPLTQGDVMDFTQRITQNETLTLAACGEGTVYLCTEPREYPSVGVRVDSLRIEVMPLDIYVIVEYTVTDEAAFALQEDGMWFEFIDPASEAGVYADQRLKGSLVSTGYISTVGEGRYVQRETLGVNELHDEYTLRAFNCWTKERYETRTFPVQQAE